MPRILKKVFKRGKNNTETNEERAAGSNVRDKQQTNSKEIVVSLKKLTKELDQMTNINRQTVNFSNTTYKLSDVIKKLKTERDEAKKILIAWIETNYDRIKNNAEHWGTIFCLLNFAFRKDFKNEVKVSFGAKNQKLSGKVNQHATQDTITLTNMEKLFTAAKTIKNDEWKQITDLPITAGQVGRTKRALRKKLTHFKLETRETAHNVKKRIIGSKNLSPKAYNQFQKFWQDFDITSYLTEDKSIDDDRFIDALKQNLTHPDFQTKSTEKDTPTQSIFNTNTSFDDLYNMPKELPETFQEHWKTFINDVKNQLAEYQEAKENAQQPTILNHPNLDNYITDSDNENEQISQTSEEAGKILKTCYENSNTLEQIINNIQNVTEYPSIFNTISKQLQIINQTNTKSKTPDKLDKNIQSLTHISGIDEDSLTKLRNKLRNLLGVNQPLSIPQPHKQT